MKILTASILLAFGCAAQAAVPALNSRHAAVYDISAKQFVLEKNADTEAPMASITKVLTAMVSLDAKPDMNETLEVGPHDVDTIKHSHSRVGVGTELSRRDMMHIALMSSENRAASALSYSYPGGHDAFINAMNRKAKAIGMTGTHVEDSTGLNPANHSTARDLVKMVLAADDYKPITYFTTQSSYELPIGSRVVKYRNSNPLVGKPNWNIELSKTGYTQEAGRCIVMKLAAGGKEYAVALMGSPSSGARMSDIQTIKRYLTNGQGESSAVAAAPTARHHGLRLARHGSRAGVYRNASLDARSQGKHKAVIQRVKFVDKAHKPKALRVRLDTKKAKTKLRRA